MKFLVMQTRTPGTPWPEDSYTMWEATRKWVDTLRDSGVLESFYWMPGQGAMGILNVPSHEELSSLLQKNPMKPMGSYSVVALSDPGVFMRQMMGGGPEAAKQVEI